MLNKIVHLVLLISLATCFIQQDIQVADNIVPTPQQNSKHWPYQKQRGHSSFNHFQIHAPVLNQNIKEIDMERPKHKKIERIEVEIEKILKKNFVIFKDSEIERIEKIGHQKKQPLYEIVLLSNQKSYNVKVTYNKKRQMLNIIEINEQNKKEGQNQQMFEEEKESNFLDETFEVLKQKLVRSVNRARFSNNLITNQLNQQNYLSKVLSNNRRFELKTE